MTAPAVDARDVTVEFAARATVPFLTRPGTRAVDGVSITVPPGEALAVVGESGSGKTTLARAIAGLVAPTCGEIRVRGIDPAGVRGGDERRLRREVQLVLQDARASLSPRRRIGYLLAEPRRVHRVRDAPGEAELLASVGLSPELAARFPHELSGGQARRVGVARALALRPSLLIADEPTSGLDASTAAGVLNLLADLREQLGLTLVLVTHDVAAASCVADRVAVMRDGRLVEVAPTDALLSAPQHPYTRLLLANAGHDGRPEDHGR